MECEFILNVQNRVEREQSVVPFPVAAMLTSSRLWNSSGSGASTGTGTEAKLIKGARAIEIQGVQLLSMGKCQQKTRTK